MTLSLMNPHTRDQCPQVNMERSSHSLERSGRRAYRGLDELPLDGAVRARGDVAVLPDGPGGDGPRREREVVPARQTLDPIALAAVLEGPLETCDRDPKVRYKDHYTINGATLTT